ncbi:MAG: hypothetical protein LUC90_05760 [Lachnospiraceae bacterium]|nr:hypothetical protein [Lachnospiraceae bacterium]
MRYIWEKARFAMILALISALVCGTGPAVCAAVDTSTLDFNRTGSVSLTLMDADGNIMVDGAMTIYEVAVISGEDDSLMYTYTEAFSGCGLTLMEDDGTLVLDANDGTLAAALAVYVADNNISGTSKKVGSDGTLCFDELELGMYLVVQTTQSTEYSGISPFLVTVPYADANGLI